MTIANTLPHRLDRTVTIHATPDTVFRFFTDTERWARWWGAGSTIDARPDGEVYIRHPGNVESRGKVLELDAPRRFVFTYGFVTGTPIPVGGSRVTIQLEPHRAGTQLTLTHDIPDDAARDEFVQGWRFQLSLFANIVSDEVTANAARFVDLWFEAWAEPDVIARQAMFGEIVVPEVRMQDRFSNLNGLQDLLPHVAAAQRFMPGMRMRRAGDVRHCQGMVLADWTMTGLDGTQRGTGTNVFVFGPSGRIEWVTGFMSAPTRAG
jgi:uncharacterized protein YndB with AHSA1/START domain